METAMDIFEVDRTQNGYSLTEIYFDGDRGGDEIERRVIYFDNLEPLLAELETKGQGARCQNIRLKGFVEKTTLSKARA